MPVVPVVPAGCVVLRCAGVESRWRRAEGAGCPVGAAPAEGPVHGTPEFVGEQYVGQPAVSEVGVAQGEPYPVQGVVAQPAGLFGGGSGGGQRVPGTRCRVGFPVLHGVQEMGQPSEEAAGLGERRGVAGSPGEHGGVREGRRGGGLGRLGDGEQGVPGPASASIPVCRPTASTRSAVSNPRAAPVRAPARSQRAATRRAAAATGLRARSPSRSATWSRIFAEASTRETAAASRAPSPRATGAVRIPRSGQGPAVRRWPVGRSA